MQLPKTRLAVAGALALLLSACGGATGGVQPEAAPVAPSDSATTSVDDAVSPTTRSVDVAEPGQEPLAQQSALLLSSQLDSVGGAKSPLSPEEFTSKATSSERYISWDSWVEDPDAHLGSSGETVWPRVGNPSLKVVHRASGDLLDFANEFGGVFSAAGALASSRVNTSGVLDLQQHAWSTEIYVRSTPDGEAVRWLGKESDRSSLYAYGWAGELLIAVATNDGAGGLSTLVLRGPGDIAFELTGGRPLAISPDGSQLVVTGLDDDLGSNVSVVDVRTGDLLGSALVLDDFVVGRGDWDGDLIVVPFETGAHVLSVETGQLEYERSIRPTDPPSGYVVAASLTRSGSIELVVEAYDLNEAGEFGTGAWSKRVEVCQIARCDVASTVGGVRGDYIASVHVTAPVGFSDELLQGFITLAEQGMDRP